MIDNLSSGKAAIVSVSSAFIGQASTEICAALNIVPNLQLINTAFQHTVWVIAIISGCISIYNGSKKWFKKK